MSAVRRSEKYSSDEFARQLYDAGVDDQIIEWVQGKDIDLQKLSIYKDQDPVVLLSEAVVLPEMSPVEGKSQHAPTPLGKRPNDDLSQESFTKGKNRYMRLSTQLGSGGMGVVYEGWDARLSIPVAIKQLAPKRQVLERDRKNFIREARVLGRFRHKNVVRVYDLTREEREGNVQYAYVMEKIGEEFHGLKHTFGRLRSNHIALVLGQLVSLMHAGAEENLYHFDLKPDNILVRDDGEIKVVDFGIANLAHEHESDEMRGFLSGSIPYVSPERATGKFDGDNFPNMTPEEQTIHFCASELFSLATLVYEMITANKRWEYDGSSREETLARIARQEPLPEEMRTAFIEAASARGFDGKKLLYVLEDVWHRTPEERIHRFSRSRKPGDVFEGFARAVASAAA